MSPKLIFSDELYYESKNSFRTKMSDKNFTQRFDIVMTLFSSDKKIKVKTTNIKARKFRAIQAGFGKELFCLERLSV